MFLSSGVYFVFKFWLLIGISAWWWVLDFLHFGWRASSWAFLVWWVSQLCAFLREGRQNSFNFTLSSGHVEVNILLFCMCPDQFWFSSDLIVLLEFFTYSVITVNTVFFWWEFFFLFLVSLFCKRCVYVFDFCILNWVFPGPWEFLWRAESCIYFVCVSPLCGVPGRYKIIWALWWYGRRDCTDFPFSLALQWRVRYGWNGEGGWSVFPLLSSVCCQFSWRLDVCGRNFGLYIFVGSFVVFSRGFLFYKLLIFQQFITGGFVAVRT